MKIFTGSAHLSTKFTTSTLRLLQVIHTFVRLGFWQQWKSTLWSSRL